MHPKSIIQTTPVTLKKMLDEEVKEFAENVKEEIQKEMDKREGTKVEDYFERGMFRGLQISLNIICTHEPKEEK